MKKIPVIQWNHIVVVIFISLIASSKDDANLEHILNEK